MKTALDTGDRPETEGAAPNSSTAVELEDVIFTYRSGERPALAGIQMAQRAGEMIGIMGASGAGKSSLVKCLNAIIPAFEHGVFQGSVRIGGRAVDGMRVCEMAPAVGMVFQDFESQLFSTNVAHEVAFAMEQVGMAPGQIRARLGPALAAVGLAGFEDRDPTSLSGGEKQRLAIASVLAVQPSIIVLDEPTTDLDPEGRGEVFDLIRQLRDRGLSLLVIEHETEELLECDRIVALRDAKVIADGPPHQVLLDLGMLRECGIRPPALNHVLAELGINAHARNVNEAEALIRKSFQVPSNPIPIGGAAPLPKPTPALPTDASPLVEVEGLSHIYGGTMRALDGVDLTINAGDFVAIIGQNGSGKTTLAKHIVGLLKPDQGRVMIAGRERSSLASGRRGRCGRLRVPESGPSDFQRYRRGRSSVRAEELRPACRRS